GRKFPSSADEQARAAWATYAALRDERPAPTVYAPHLWRLYRDTLERWEQLARAGHAADRLDKLKKEAAQLEAELRKQSRLDLGGREITRTLVLPDALGLVSPWSRPGKERDGLRERFTALWLERKEPEREKGLEELLAWVQLNETARRGERGALL